MKERLWCFDVIRSLKIGLFLGVGAAPLSLFLFRYLGFNYMTLVISCYIIVGACAITSIVTHKKLNMPRGKPLSIENQVGEWITMHTRRGEKFRGILKKVEDEHIHLTNAFLTEGKFKILNNLVISKDQIERIES